jgi:hypothetical protein
MELKSKQNADNYDNVGDKIYLVNLIFNVQLTHVIPVEACIDIVFKIQSIPQRKHNTLTLQGSTG